MPVLPFLEDNTDNILAIVHKAKEAGARFLYPAFGMTLRDRQKEWYFQKLDTLFSGQNLRQQYARAFGNSYQCVSPHAKTLWKEFSAVCEQEGLLFRMQDIIRAYKMGYGDSQLTFF